MLVKNKSKGGNTAGSTSPLATIGAPLALLVVLLATLVPFFMRDTAWAVASYKYVYSAGALALLLVRLFTPYRGDDLRLKRLHRIESWSAVFFCAAAVFLFYPGAELRDWLAIPARESKLTQNK